MSKGLTLGLAAALLVGAQLSTWARSHSYQLSDGVVVTMDVQPSQTVLTLAGQPYANYRLECTVQFDGWTTLTNATLNGVGTFSYVDTSSLPMCFYRVLAAVTFVSVAAEDGRVTDKPGEGGTGAAVDTTDNGGLALRAGDFGGTEKQHKGFVSFDTSSIPDGAMVIGATLRLRRGGVVGANPFLTHGTCWIDIKGGAGFGGAPSLVAGDFQAAADAAQVGAMSNAGSDGEWCSSTISAAGLSFINRTGRTQFRVYFALHDNNDGKADYIGWYSGENATAGNRPVLEVLYR